jgi:hypothetical protein
MSGFAVNMTGLAALSVLVRRAGDALTATSNHLGRAQFDAFGGVLAPLATTARDIGAFQIGAINQAATLCVGNATAIDTAAAYYRVTDQRQAAIFDTQQARVAAPVLTAPAGSRRAYADPRVPAGRLTEPPSYAQEMSWRPSIESDLGKVGPTIAWLIKQVFGVDVLQEIGEWLLSDWPEIRRIADRFNNAAWACADVATNLRAGISDAEQDWRGNAAGQALSWLEDLARALDSAREQNAYLAENYQRLADGFFELFTALVGLLGDWVNKLLLAAASGAAAGMAEEVPVLDVILDVNAGAKIWEAVHAGYQVYDKVTRAKDLAEAITAALTIGQGAFGDLSAQASPMPNAPWDTVFYPP